MPHLDGLRVLAVMLVFWEHWLGKPIFFLPAGRMGVNLFFVLSGFLITNILLSEKENGLPLKRNLGVFYIRRFLRIFPVYYLLLFILFLLKADYFMDHAGWYLTYTSNIYSAIVHHWGNPLDHTWSLSVEEQFYIIWPLLIFLVPVKKLSYLVYGTILVGIVFRFFGALSGYNEIIFYVLTPGNIDVLAVGALLALYRKNSLKFFLSDSRYSVYLLVLSFLIYAFCIWTQDRVAQICLAPFAFAIFSVILIGMGSTGFKGPVKTFFENKFIIYLGKISYSLYLYHMFIPIMYNFLHQKAVQYNLHIPRHNTLIFPDLSRAKLFPVFLAAAIFLSHLSWKYFEQPINNLKNKFKYG